MPDVGRSDSQRSHCSQRPRVSFNRDVHVKRIGPSVGVGSGGGSAGGGGVGGSTGSGGGGRLVGALAGDGAGHLVPLAVRRERPSRLSRRQLAEEARRVLQQAERVACTSSADGSRRFATLPPLRLGRKGARRTLSLREKTGSRAESPSPASGPVAPPRLGGGKRARVTLTRSASDAGRRDTPSGDNAKFASLQRPKKQRSYSDQDRSPSPTAKPRRHILKKSHSDSESTPTAPLAADVRVKKQLSPIIEVSPREDYFTEAEMLRGGAGGHRGRSAVETMVRRLSADAVGPPRRPPRGVSPSALVAPGEDRRHNNNLPFSYTDGRAPSPTRPVASAAAASPLQAKSPPQQVIYAEVVVSGSGHGKQTVHTTHVPLHSDEDEGLGMADRGRADGMDARRRDPLLEESSRFDGNDLSSRRDRLESRIESQRKERFTSGRLATDTSYSSRRDFLHSQLNDYDGDSRRYNDSDKKDIFADSGIEVDYRKDSAGSGFQRFDDSPNDSLTAKIVIGGGGGSGGGGGGGVTSRKEESRVTRVELNGRARDEDTDGGGGSYFHSKTHREHRSGGAGSTTFSSTRLVQEQRRSSDVLPTSSVLIRHYAPGRGGSPSASDRFLQAERSHVRAVDHDPAPASEDEYETRAPRREISPAHSPSGRGSPEQPSPSSLKDKKKDTAKKKNVSAMDRVKQLFTRSNGDSKTLKKTKKKELKAKESLDEEDEDPVRARYTEYRGGGRTESDQEMVTASRGGSPSRQGSPTRQASPTRHRDQRTPSPYMHGPPPPSSRYREHSPVHVPPSPRRGPSPLPPDPHLLQVPGRQHHARSPHDGTRKSPRREQQREVEFNYSRQRLATPDVTPTPSPAPARAAQSSATLTRINNQKNRDQHGGNWFKSLDRLTKRNKNRIKEDDVISNKDKSNGNSKTLRYFGDTDQEDKDSVASIPPPMPLQNHYRYKSSNHLGHSNSNSINRIHISSRNTTNRSHRPHHRSAGDVATSSAESTTEGDSSQQSQRSIVYLHAATVGDIPTPIKRNVTRRAQSREELSSVTSSHLQPQKRTISRSISVLAPWRPRHYREGQELHYDQEDNNKNYIKNGKPPKIPLSQQSSLNSATMNRINRKKNAENKMNGSYKHYVGKATSTESLSQHSTRQYGDSRGTLKKHIPMHQAASVESLSHHSNHSSSRLQNKSKANDKKNAMNTSMSELATNNKQNTQQRNKTNDVGKKNSSKVSRSASMPKDSRVKAGWFKLRNKKQGT